MPPSMLLWMLLSKSLSMLPWKLSKLPLMQLWKLLQRLPWKLSRLPLMRLSCLRMPQGRLP